MFVGSIVSNVATLARQDVLTSESVWVTVLIGIGAALQAMVGASLVARVVGRRSDLSDGRSIIGFLLLAGPVASVVNAIIATTAQLGLGLLSSDQGMALWVTW